MTKTETEYVDLDLITDAEWHEIYYCAGLDTEVADEWLGVDGKKPDKELTVAQVTEIMEGLQSKLERLEAGELNDYPNEHKHVGTTTHRWIAELKYVLAIMEVALDDYHRRGAAR